MEITLTIEKLAGEGNGLGYFEDKAVFVPGLLPGEVARVKLIKVKRRWAEGAVVQILTLHPSRGANFESHSWSCSPWQTVDYPLQVQLKSQLLAEAYKGNRSIETAAVVSSPKTSAYRNKIEFSLVHRQAGYELAFHTRSDYHDFVAAPDGCCLADPAMNAAAVSLIEAINVIDKDNHYDYSSLLLRHGHDELPIAVLTGNPGLTRTKANNLIYALDLPRLGLGGVMVVVEQGHRNYETLASRGRTELRFLINGLEFRCPWEGFFQINVPAFKLALSAIIAGVPKGAYVVDLYGGVGAIGLAVAPHAAQVTGVELHAGAANFAERNAKAQKRANYCSLSVGAEFTSDELLASADVVIVDPPRAGLSPRTLRVLRVAKPLRLIYLSCNPITQARDLAGLADMYVPLDPIVGFDFYPGTTHLESLAILDRRPGV